jgi:hypothetical protein
MEHLTSGATEAEYELFRSSLADISVTSFYASNHPFSSHAENWGWNTLDLLWEAHLTPKDSVFVYILKFRPGFDFAPVMERFRQRDYEEAERDGLHIFLGGSNMLVESIRTSELSVRNATIDTANSLMFLSGDSDNFAEFQEARAAQRTMADWPEMADTARQLSPTFAAVLRPGLDTCHRLGSRPMMDAMFRGESAESLRQMIEDSPMLAPYQVFGLGYRFEEINEENSAVWSLVMHYPDASLAQADLEVRKRIIAEMYSLQEPDRLYSDLVDVRSAEVVGNQMVLRLHAVNGNPRLVLNMFFHDDMFFASC